jgi:ribosome-interacting GTPase 1
VDSSSTKALTQKSESVMIQYFHLTQIKSIAAEYKLHNVEIVMRGKVGLDDLIDAIEGNRVFIPALFVINKIDSITIEELDLLDQIPNYVMVSAHKVNQCVT